MPKDRKTKMLAYLALFVINTIWALSAIIAKTAFDEIHPLMLLFLRFSLASIVFSPMIIVKHEKESIRKKDIPRLVFLSFLITGLGGGGWIVGLFFTTATQAAIIASLGPVIASILERILLNKKRKVLSYIGVVLGLCGIALIVLKPLIFGNNGMTNNTSPLLSLIGDLLIFSSAFGSALYVVLAQRKEDNLHPYQKTAFSFIIGTLIFLPFALYIHIKDPSWTLNLTWKAWIGVLYFGIACSAIAYGLWQWAVEKVSAMESAIFTYVEPLVAIVAAILLLHEAPTLTDGIGGILIVIGVFLTTVYQNSTVK